MDLDTEDEVVLDDEKTFIGKWGRVAAITVFGALIFAAFSAVLVTAMTQHQITRNLASGEERVSFADAYYILESIEGLNTSKSELEGSVSETLTNLETESQRLRDLQATLLEDLRRLTTVGKSTRAREACPSQFPETINAELLDDDNILDRLERCKVNATAFGALGIEPSIFGKVRGFKREISATETRMENFEATLESDQAELADVERNINRAKSFENDFSPQKRLAKILPDGLHWIFEIPPSIMPIFLTFVSGIFGSLLVNLILIVYPSNSVGLYHGQRFLQHVILGGLIATAVYIVIGAGASVLSLSDDGASPDTYLTFSAIGIFAGMFSDRAAKWLSDNVPFERKGGDDGAGDDGAND